MLPPPLTTTTTTTTKTAAGAGAAGTTACTPSASSPTSLTPVPPPSTGGTRTTPRSTHEVNETLSYASLHAAVAAAHDDDVIVLEPGIHLTGSVGYAIDIHRRVCIVGASEKPGDVVIDHRGNVPLFRISRSCLIQDVEIDATGFCDTVRIVSEKAVRDTTASGFGGKATRPVHPVFRQCYIKVGDHDDHIHLS
jgi:hypothetical protein